MYISYRFASAKEDISPAHPLEHVQNNVSRELKLYSRAAIFYRLPPFSSCTSFSCSVSSPSSSMWPTKMR